MQYNKKYNNILTIERGVVCIYNLLNWANLIWIDWFGLTWLKLSLQVWILKFRVWIVLVILFLLIFLNFFVFILLIKFIIYIIIFQLTFFFLIILLIHLFIFKCNYFIKQTALHFFVSKFVFSILFIIIQKWCCFVWNIILLLFFFSNNKLWLKFLFILALKFAIFVFIKATLLQILEQIFILILFICICWGEVEFNISVVNFLSIHFFIFFFHFIYFYFF